MSSELGSSPPPSTAMPNFWRAFADVLITGAGALLLGLNAESMHSWFKWPTAVLALIMLVVWNFKCCTAGEYLSKAKGAYHPMYGSLGPLGLLLALFARPTRDA